MTIIPTFNDATHGLAAYLNEGGIGDAIGAPVQSIATLAELLAYKKAKIGQTYLVGGKPWLIVSAGTLAVSPTVQDMTAIAAQAVSTSLTQDCTFAEDTRTIAFLRSVYGASATVTAAFAGFKYDLELDQAGSGTGYVSSTSGVKFRVLPDEDGSVCPIRFGAAGNDVADDRLPIQAAHDAFRVVDYSDKVFKVSGVISITKSASIARGSGATIKPSVLMTYVFRSQGVNDFEVGGLVFDAGVTGSSTALRIEDNSTISAYRAKVFNCTFKGFKTPIRLLGVADFDIAHNTILDFENYAILCSVNADRALKSGRITENTVLCPTVTSGHLGSIYALGNVVANVEYRFDDVIVSNNTIRGGYYAGVRIERSRSSVVIGNTISGMFGTSVGFAVLLGVGAQNCDVIGNTVRDCDEGPTNDTSDTVLTPNVTTHGNNISGNNIYQVTKVGIRVNTGALVSVIGNTVRNCQTGIFLSGNNIGTQNPAASTYRSGYNHTVSGNIVERCSRAGIQLANSFIDEATVSGNTVRHCNQDLLSISGGVLIEGGTGHVVMGNRCSKNKNSTTDRGDFYIVANAVSSLLLQGNSGNIRLAYATLADLLNINVVGQKWPDNFPWATGGQFAEIVKTTSLNGATAYHFGSESYYANPNGGAITLNSTTPIAAGYEGQRLTLVNVHPVNDLIVPSSGNVALASALTIPALSAASFIYSAVSAKWFREA